MEKSIHNACKGTKVAQKLVNQSMPLICIASSLSYDTYIIHDIYDMQFLQ